MNLRWGVLLRALSFAAAIGLVWTGIVFLSYGAYVVLLPIAGVGGAALLVALMCFVIGGPLLTALIVWAPLPHAQRLQAETPIAQGGTVIKALSELAEDHPLMAVFCAAILGATNGTNSTRRH